VAYDPALTSLIIVGTFGSLAAFLNISADWEISGELSRVTDRWTAPLVVRTYRDDATAQRRVAREAAVLREHGYQAVLQRGGSRDFVAGGVSPTGERIALPRVSASGMIAITYRLA